jgi:virulence-associated protein VapD
MVSTYASYNSIVRNLTQSMTRIGQQTDVAQSATYYKNNIGKVKTVDDLLKDQRLYEYAMKAYGLDDMIYAKAFMKQVLDSDLSDTNSFANRLNDKRYREFAAAFSFSSAGTYVAQSDNQTDEMVGLYSAAVKRQVEAIDERTLNYNSTIGNIKSVDDLLNDDSMRSYVFSAFSIDDSQWSRETIKGVLSSDSSDPNSYLNTVWTSRLPDINASITKAQANIADANTRIATYTAQLSQPGANMSDLRAKLVVERSIVLKNTGNIISANDAITMIGRYKDLADAFQFSADGTLAPGVSAQTDVERTSTNEGFVNSQGAAYLAANEDNEALMTRLFRANIANIKTVDAFVSTPNVFNYAMKSVGLDPEKVSAATIKAVLKSDASDPKSYVYTLKDDRYVKLARAFNFDSKGQLTTVLVAQDTTEVTQTMKDYIISKTRFASEKDMAGLREAAEKDAVYYQNTIPDIENISDLLADRKMIDIILVAKGLQPEKVTTAFLKQVFESDLSDKKSFANKQTDPRFAEIAMSFNFDDNGDVARLAAIGPQTRDQLLTTQNKYLQQSLEVQEGDVNPGTRLALYFQRKAASITSAYDILGDKALSEVFRTTYSLPDSFGAMQVDQQAKVVEKYLNLKDLGDPTKLEKMLSRFSVMYDLKNNAASSPALTILQGSNTGIGASIYTAIASMGRR